jgi:cysteinyl-tRNA synthetase
VSRVRLVAAALVLCAGAAAACSDPADPPVALPSAPVIPSAPWSASAPAPSSAPASSSTPKHTAPAPKPIRNWAYQLQDYPGGRLDKLAAGPYQLVVIDLARDAKSDWFTHAEIARVRATGKRVLSYFEIGTIEDFRPEYPVLRAKAPDLIANEWDEWPGEYFVRYYDERWWSMVVKPRVDQALRAGFDGLYLDTPLAYEQIDLAGVPGRDRARLAHDMAALIARISRYAKARHPGLLIVPQNSPELRHQPGYTAAIDGIGMEELFFQATDERCTEDFCAENLAETRALRDAGKFVLSVDYATRAADVRAACSHYRAERFAGTVTVLDLDRTSPPCP